MQALLGVLVHFPDASPGKIRSRRTPLRYFSKDLRRVQGMFLCRIECRNLTLLLSPANRIKRSIAVFVTRISIDGTAVLLLREYQIPQVVYRAVFRKLPDIRSAINGQLINDSARLLCTGQPAPLNYCFCLRDGRFFHAIIFRVFVTVGSLLLVRYLCLSASERPRRERSLILHGSRIHVGDYMDSGFMEAKFRIQLQRLRWHAICGPWSSKYHHRFLRLPKYQLPSAP